MLPHYLIASPPSTQHSTHVEKGNYFRNLRSVRAFVLILTENRDQKSRFRLCCKRKCPRHRILVPRSSFPVSRGALLALDDPTPPLLYLFYLLGIYLTTAAFNISLAAKYKVTKMAAACIFCKIVKGNHLPHLIPCELIILRSHT